MFPLIKRFFTDEAAFSAAFGASANKVRGVLIALALGLNSGVPPFDRLTAYLGGAGWVGTGVLIVAASMISAGKAPAPLTALTDKQAEVLAAHAKSVVPDEPAKPPVGPGPEVVK